MTVDEFLKLHWRNLHRLWVWMNVGADVENGMWAIYGARLGLYKTMLTDWDYVNVRDFDYLTELWNSTKTQVSEENIFEKTQDLGKELIRELKVPISVKDIYEEFSSVSLRNLNFTFDHYVSKKGKWALPGRIRFEDKEKGSNSAI